MEIIDNINHLLGENLKRTIKANAKLKIAASCFSIYAFAILKRELERIARLNSTTTSTFALPQSPIRSKKYFIWSLPPFFSTFSVAVDVRPPTKTQGFMASVN
jgi:hypothetical protein